MKLLQAPLLALTLLGLAGTATAQDRMEAPRAAIAQYNLDKGLALDGYDPTAYFPEAGGKPVKGKKQFELKHRGVTYRFANEANQERFAEAPERYEPAYGGWCAWAMASGDKADIDPKSYLIENDRLLVFYKGFLNDTRKKWKKGDSSKLTPKADKQWKKLSGESSGRDVSQYNLKSGLALGGYDPVGYVEGSARSGKKALTATYQGVQYRFASEASRKTFQAKPANFEPHYGGWCAWAMSQGKKVPVDPDAYVRDESGLFLFYNAAKRDEWKAARKQMTRDANKHWAELTKS